MLRVLVISGLPWRTDNSFGNTYSNWFSKMNDISIAHLCLGDGIPSTERNVDAYYFVSEKKLAKSIFAFHLQNNSIGEVVYPNLTNETQKKNHKSSDNSIYGRALALGKLYHPAILYILKDAIWKFGNINYQGIYSFIEEFNPDVIFMGMNYRCNMDRVAMKIHKKFNIPIVLEVSIDVYTLKQVSYDPFYWINRFLIRRKTKQIAKVASLLYTISEKQLLDYRKYFNLPMKVMYKFSDKNRMLCAYSPQNRPLKYLYTGNLGTGRWESLSFLAKALSDTCAGTLDIYSATTLSENQKAQLNIKGVSRLHGPITQTEVIEKQNQADVLVHVESFNLKNKLEVRYSISTKIMDYISVGRCIMAIGPEDIASIDYLRENKLAVVADSEGRIKELVSRLKINPAIVSELAANNRNFVSNNLNEDMQRAEFYQDLKNVCR